MKFNAETLRPYVKGCMEVAEENGAIAFHRFTEEQKTVYPETGVGLKRTRNITGIRLEFNTDATKLTFTSINNLKSASVSEIRFCFDVEVNGALVRHGGFVKSPNPEDPADSLMPDIPMEFNFEPGEKKIVVYLPSLYNIQLKDVELHGESYVKPVVNRHRIIAFGDSITEDCSVSYPYLSYINIVAREFDAELFNFGIGGECFKANKIKDVPYPDGDFVVSAYGTNDLSRKDVEFFFNNMTTYLETLHERYANVPVFILLPTYRMRDGGFKEGRPVPSLQFVRDEITKEAAKYENFHVIDAKSFVPHLPEFYKDGYLHPNDLGHTLYGLRVASEIRKILGTEF